MNVPSLKIWKYEHKSLCSVHPNSHARYSKCLNDLFSWSRGGGLLSHTHFLQMEQQLSCIWEADVYYLKSTTVKNKNQNYFSACWFRKAPYSSQQGYFFFSFYFFYNSSQINFFKYSYLISHLLRLIGWVSYYRQMQSRTIIILFKIF